MEANNVEKRFNDWFTVSYDRLRNLVGRYGALAVSYTHLLAILKKYESHPICLKQGTCLPVVCNQKANSYLKEIADFCGIKKNLTTHAARHTFATTVTLANNVPLQEVSAMLGHASTRMTQHYARVMDRNLKDNMNIVRSKMGL